MARIRDTKGRRTSDSGYTRLLGHAGLGDLLSRVHATVIRNGNELESLIGSACTNRSAQLGAALNGQLRAERPELEVFLNEKLPLTETGGTVAFDVVVLDHGNSHAFVIELKDGDAFDTKKSQGELESLKRVAGHVRECTGYETEMRFCCFNQSDKSIILAGAKGRFAEEQVLTGQEFCDLLQISYDQILERRREDAQDNLQYFVSEIKRILNA